MTVMLLGDGPLASEFATACQHGGREFVRVRGSALTTQGIRDSIRVQDPLALLDAGIPVIEASASVVVHRVSMETGTPLLRAVPPAFATSPTASRWTWVDSYADAVQTAEARGGAVFSVFTSLVADTGLDGPADDRLMPAPAGSKTSTITGDSAPAEKMTVPPPVKRALRMLRQRGVNCVLAADTGDHETFAVLKAADLAGIGVVIVRRPPEPEPAVSVALDLAAMFSWLRKVEADR